MTARYRLVEFLADPFTGARFPIAALVQVGRRVAVARAPQVVDLGLGYATGAHTTARFIVDSLESSATTIDSLPVSAGPHAVLGDEKMVPEGVESPVSWIQDTLLRPSTPALLKPSVKTKGREATGFRFLQQWNVAQWVGRRFRAQDHVRGRKIGLILPDVAQYVSGPAGLLLMEPLVVESATYSRALRHVGTTFAAWKHGLDLVPDLMPHRRRGELIAYVLSGDRREAVDEAKEALSGSADRVVDVNMADERAAFFDSIRAAAAPPLH